MQDGPKRCSRCGESYPAEVIFCPRDGTPLGARRTDVGDDRYLGLTIAGQLRVERLIGIGAMGRVYRAHQFGVERPVAVKIVHRDLCRNEALLARFRREARVASQLAHPNLVQVLMAGELPDDVGGEAYLVLEYLDGISLKSALAAQGGALPLARALHVVLQICDAVGEAHAHGVVHRDLKPENVMLVRRGNDADFAKVLDFGVARTGGSDDALATQAGAVFGTPRYVSPEGARGEAVGPASDVYAIATIAYECLAGVTPFDGASPVAILVQHTSAEPPPLSTHARASYVPEPIAAAILANLAKSPEARCPDARSFGRTLVDAARAAGLSPDDLVPRSTLLGAGSSALALPSLQRTKTLALNEGLRDRMSGASRTEPGEPPEPVLPTPSGVETTLIDETRESLSLPPPSIPRASASPRAARRSWLPLVAVALLAATLGAALSWLASRRASDQPRTEAANASAPSRANTAPPETQLHAIEGGAEATDDAVATAPQPAVKAQRKAAAPPAATPSAVPSSAPAAATDSAAGRWL